MDQQTGQFTASLAVLTAMITPAVLISASGTLILSTSTRLGRVVDRVREISNIMEDLYNYKGGLLLLTERRFMLFQQLEKLITRATLLQRCLTIFYCSVGVFVLTSVAIGLVAVTGRNYSWIPVITGLIGSCSLFYGCLLLVFEARMAFSLTKLEMEFIRRLGEAHTSTELSDERGINEDFDNSLQSS